MGREKDKIMDRKTLVELFQSGMKYNPGKHRFWISRCFEIHVRADHVVELDEYEGFDAEETPVALKHLIPPAKPAKQKMFHVGRSIVDLKAGQVTEHPGSGWERLS